MQEKQFIENTDTITWTLNKILTTDFNQKVETEIIIN